MQGTGFSGGQLGSQVCDTARGFQPIPVRTKRSDIPPASLKSIAEHPPLWWVCTTNHSYDIAWRMIAGGCDYYLPLEPRKIEYWEGDRKRKRVKQFPLFPGWIFLNGEKARTFAYDLYLRPQALHAKYQPIFHNELLVIEEGLRLDRWERPKCNAKPGDKVTVNAGFCEGLEMTVDRVSESKSKVEGYLKNGIVLEVDLPDLAN